MQNCGIKFTYLMVIDFDLYKERSEKQICQNFLLYRIAQNVGGVKHWRIPLKTALVKKILANASLTSNETLLAKNDSNNRYA